MNERTSNSPELAIQTRGRTTWLWVLGAIVLLLGGGAAGWAATIILTPPSEVADAPNFALAEVTSSSIGASVSTSVTGEWLLTPAAANRKPGTVTGIEVPTGPASTGDILYTVDLSPVVVATGSVPAFRNVAEGTKGPDVAQIQQMLAELGFYSGSIDGDAGAGTSAAIKRWQKASDVPVTGTIGLGDVLFVSQLPARLSLNPESITVGAQLSGGEPAVDSLSAAPRFTIQTSDGQGATVSPGTPVQIASPSGATWGAVTGIQSRDEAGQITIELTSTSGDPICGVECDEIPPTNSLALNAKLVTVPEVAGLSIPTACLTTRPDGSTFVVDENGNRRDVQVQASSGGISIIQGVAAGDQIRLPPAEQG
jgi:peptidoglycan hydrolase-like protein with peptidoglycan-binding domain